MFSFECKLSWDAIAGEARADFVTGQYERSKHLPLAHICQNDIIIIIIIISQLN